MNPERASLAGVVAIVASACRPSASPTTQPSADRAAPAPTATSLAPPSVSSEEPPSIGAYAPCADAGPPPPVDGEISRCVLRVIRASSGGPANVTLRVPLTE